VAALAIIAVAACGGNGKKTADTTTVAAPAKADTSTTAVAPVATQPQAPTPASSSPKATVHSTWVVTDSGAGVLRIGMTRDQLALDLHAPVPKHTRADSGCAYLAIAGIPPGMRTMWVAATLARIDIGAPKLSTDRGVKIGDKQSKVETLYRGRISAMPAKYDPRGKYLVVRPVPPADSSRRIVFETDGSTKVTRYRVGREPEVEWVEGCS
jgi:hypothetical protein